MGSDIRFSFVHRNAETLYTLPYTISYITFSTIIDFLK